MDLADPFQAVMLAFAAGTLLAALFSRVAAVLFLWWAAGMAAWAVSAELPSQAFYAMDGIAAVTVGLLARRGTDMLILLLFVFPLVARLVGDAEIDWLVSWATGMAQMGLAMAGASVKMAPIMRRRVARARCQRRIHRGLRFASC